MIGRHPSEAAIQAEMEEAGINRLQAIRLIQAREWLKKQAARPSR